MQPHSLILRKMKLYSDAALAKILDKDIFHLIGNVADELGVECYVVGGYVRDIFLERPSDDIDVVVVGSGIRVAEALKQRLGRRAHLSVFRNFGTAQVKVAVGNWQLANSQEPRAKSLEIEFVGARKESYSHDSRKPIVEDGTLEDDQNRRDFTINAMAICLNHSRFGQLVDPFNGIADLEDGIIATPLDPEVTFSDDPLRMMRCIRFATQLNFRIEDETFEALQRMASRIKIVSAERIEVELNKIMMAPHPSIGFELLQRSGLLQIILPELAALDIVEKRDNHAHKNNFYHTLEVLENVVRSENSSLLPSPSSLFVVFLPTIAQYVLCTSPSANILLSRVSAFDVRAKTTSPATGRSSRCTTPRNTSPSFWYFSLIYSFTLSDSGLSPVLSPCTISPLSLETMMIWLSS